MTMQLLDLKDMPGFNPSVPNGIDSVSRGECFLDGYHVGFEGSKERVFMYPVCRKHGAMNRVSVDGIYRCLHLACDSGCYCPESMRR